jgi:hypothetical protein
MTPEEYGLWCHASAVSHESREFYLSGPKVARHFSDTGKNVIYRIGRQLVAKGWFFVVRERAKNLNTGLWTPPIVRPLTHAEWIDRYSTSACIEDAFDPCPKPGMDQTDDPRPTSSMPDSDASMTDLSQSMPVLSQSMTGNGNKSYKESYCESKNKREWKKNPESKTAHTLSSSTENEQDLGQIKIAVEEVQQWMLGLDPPLKFMPASKDKETESTKTTITERLLERPANPNDVRLTIAVTVRPTRVEVGNLGFLGGWL